jgi:IS4 transposase
VFRPAELVALAYRYRWTVELFFRWFKCILGCRHWQGESLNALTIQVYAGLIASLLLTVWTNQKPNKRTFEMMCHYMAGWAPNKNYKTISTKRKIVRKCNRQDHSKQCAAHY